MVYDNSKNTQWEYFPHLLPFSTCICRLAFACACSRLLCRANKHTPLRACFGPCNAQPHDLSPCLRIRFIFFSFLTCLSCRGTLDYVCLVLMLFCVHPSYVRNRKIIIISFDLGKIVFEQQQRKRRKKREKESRRDWP